MSPDPFSGQRAPEAFFRAQKRNRRATWRMSLLCMAAALVMGVPLTLVLTPLIYAATLVIADVWNYFSPLPPEFWQNIELVARILQQVQGALTSNRSIDPVLIGFAAAVVLLPGMVIALLLWMGLRTILHRGGVGGLLTSLEARLPDKNDLKELQLADVVEEMSIAAGLPAPRVMLIDSGGANAAAIGTSAMDARIVISRNLLDDLDREQLQGVLAHLISSIGNGDLDIAFTVTSVFETGGLLVTIINSPFGPHSRGTLWRLIRYSFSSRISAAGSDSEADQLAALLTQKMNLSSDDIDRFFDSSEPAPVWRRFLRFVFFPIVFTNAAVEMTLWSFTSVLLGPAMALMWRTRRYLADASAVQLTRNPEGLASALQALSADDTSVPGGGWGGHLFIMKPGRDTSMGSQQPSRAQMERVLRTWREAGGESSAGTADPAEISALQSELKKTVMAAMRGDTTAMARMKAFKAAGGLDSSGKSGLQEQSMVSFHPPLKRRLKRLERMGAHVDLGTPAKKPLWTKAALAVVWLVLGPLIILSGAAILTAITVMIGLNLIFLAIWLALIHLIFGLIGHQ